MATDHETPAAVEHERPAGTSIGAAQPPRPVTHRAPRWLIFAIAGVSLLMASIDQTIVATALRSIQRDLDASITWSAWTITIYALGQTVAMPIAGKISDQYGRKKVFLLAALLFTVASVCCSLADNIYLLVVFRALQSLGGGAFYPCATGMVADRFGKDRDRAVGMFASIFPLGGIIGPIVGGIIVDYWSWRDIFLVNIPIGGALILLGARFIPPSASRVTRTVDIHGVVLFAVTMLGAMYTISAVAGPKQSWTWPAVGAVGVVVASGTTLFVRHARRHPAPFIPLRLMRGRGYGVMNSFNMLLGSVAVGFNTTVPLYAQERYGIRVLESGTLLTARALGMICVAGVTTMAIRRTGYRIPLTVGGGIIAAGMVAIAIPPPGALSPYLWLSVTAGFTGIGMGMSSPASSNAMLHLAGGDIAAVAGLRGMFRQCGAIISVSFITAVLAGSSDVGATQAWVFVGFAVLLAVALPLLRKIPDRRGSW